MANDQPIRFCLLTCLLKRFVKYVIELWLCIVEYYLGKYGALCNVLEFLPRVFWLTMRTRGYVPACCGNGDSRNKANFYINEIVKGIYENNIYGLHEIQDWKKRFYKTIASVNIHGEASMFTYLTGVRTLHRLKDASLQEENGQLQLKAEFGAGLLNFYSSLKVKFMKVGPTFMFRGKIGYMEAHAEFSLDTETGRNGRLKEFVISDLRGMRVEITDFKPINWILNQIIESKIFGRYFHNLVEIGMENYIRETIPNFQFPPYFGLEEAAVVNHIPAAESTESTSEPIIAESSNEQIADATQQNSEENPGTSAEETSNATDSPKYITAVTEGAGETIADATEQDCEGKPGTSAEETSKATESPKYKLQLKKLISTAAKEVAGETIADATEQDCEGKSATGVEETEKTTDSPKYTTAFKEGAGEKNVDATEQDSEGKPGTNVEETAKAADIPEFNSAVKEKAGADDPASIKTSELEKSETTLSAISSSSSDLETTCDVSDLD